MLRKERKYREIRNKKKSMGIKNRHRSAKIQIIQIAERKENFKRGVNI